MVKKYKTRKETQDSPPHLLLRGLLWQLSDNNKGVGPYFFTSFASFLIVSTSSHTKMTEFKSAWSDTQSVY